MSPVLQSVQLFLLAGVAFLVVGTLITALLVRGFRSRVLHWEARTRHRAIVFLASLPVLSALALLLSASLPSLIALFAPGLDHCPSHDDDHAHLCFVHLPELGINLASQLGLVFVFTYALMRAGLFIDSLLRASRLARALARSGTQRTDLGVTVLEVAQPVCLTAGLLRPRVLLSRGLLESLTQAELAIVLAHERAHVRRRDAFVASLVRALAGAHLPAVARWLVQELAIAAEQACDEEASRCAGDRVAVACAILRVERAVQNEAAPALGAVALAFGACAVERRVESLLAEPAPPAPLRGLFGACGLATTLVLLVADDLHHMTESLLSVLAH